MNKEMQGDVCVCKVTGKVDTLTSPDLEKLVLGVIDEGHLKIVLDLTEMSYISSAGLRIFLLAQKKLQGTDGALVVMGLKENLKSIFEISGFTRFFCFTETIEEAVAYWDR